MCAEVGFGGVLESGTGSCWYPGYGGGIERATSSLDISHALLETLKVIYGYIRCQIANKKSLKSQWSTQEAGVIYHRFKGFLFDQ